MMRQSLSIAGKLVFINAECKFFGPVEDYWIRLDLFFEKNVVGLFFGYDCFAKTIELWELQNYDGRPILEQWKS